MEWHFGRWIVAIYWRDWFTVRQFPISRFGRLPGTCWCVGPFRLGWYPKDVYVRGAARRATVAQSDDRHLS